MAQISKRRLENKLWLAMWNRLVFAITESKRSEVEDLLVGLLTQTEQVMVAKRLMVGILVWSGWRVYEIAEALKLSTATVYKHREFYLRNERYCGLIERSFTKIEKKVGEDRGFGDNIILKLLEVPFVVRRNRLRAITRKR